ncbi:hypothetical protein HYALB_00005094 [Hymenoscyphus albidus]|uniref:Uncharacterized protein n=1 Tax=Hymenoscyphus albidus TaxID=595503 RepID=A0A9N9LZF7_9HELO|nr:hypothetical protein HYALB_00005094 [Hymenoscyphus albidus]
MKPARNPTHLHCFSLAAHHRSQTKLVAIEIMAQYQENAAAAAAQPEMEERDVVGENGAAAHDEDGDSVNWAQLTGGEWKKVLFSCLFPSDLANCVCLAVLDLMDGRQSNTDAVVAALEPRRPAYITSEKWARLLTITNDLRERQVMWETEEEALADLEVIFAMAEGLMLRKGYDREGRWTGSGPEPSTFPLPAFHVPVVLDRNQLPYYAGFPRDSYKRAQKGLVERYLDRNKHQKASPKRLAQAVESGLFYLEMVDILCGREERNALGSARA